VNELKSILFGMLCIGTAINLLGLVATIFAKFQIWPPPKKQSWQFWLTWISFIFLMMGIPILGILDFGTLGLTHFSRYIIGGGLILFSVPIGLLAIQKLSLRQTLGLEGKLLTSGIYRYSRNPQYVTHVLLVVAIVLITNSMLVLTVGVFYSLWFMISPFSEELWLEKQFGRAYEEYCNRVPRFIGFRNLKSK